MTVEAVGLSPESAPETATYPRPPRRVLGIGSGQIVTLQLAVVLLLGAAQLSMLALLAALPLAAGMLILGWGRMRGRWLSQWLAVALRYRSRSRHVPAGTDGGALLALAHPGARVSTCEIEGVSSAMLADPQGLVALLELGDAAVLPAQQWHQVPSPVALLPAPAPDTPPVRVQLLLHSVNTTGSAPAMASYRQLTGGRLLAGERALLAVRVERAAGWPEADLERALAGAVRKVRAKLTGIPHRLLGDAGTVRSLGELTAHDGTRSAQEGWSALHIGGLLHATFAVDRWPQTDPANSLLPRLVRLPATTTTLALTAGPWPEAGGPQAERNGTAQIPDQVQVELAVRVAAPDQSGLSSAASALERALAASHGYARRMDGEQLDGLLATLPTAGLSPAGLISGGPPHLQPTAAVAAMTGVLGGSGLLIGLNRHQEPVAVRLFRPEVTRAVLIGGAGGAQVIAVRAMALGAHVLVQTTRPGAWEAFSRGLGSGAPLTVMAPGPVTVPPGTPLRPLLTVVDAGPVAADRSAGSPWHSTLVVRDDLSPVDVDVLGRADLALLQPLHPAEAAVAVSVLGLSRDQESWMARAQPSMVGVVHRRSMRWAMFAQTPYEQQLIGSLARQP